MEQNSLKMFCFFLRFMLLLQVTNSMNQFHLEANASQPEVYERMSKIEATNQLQANEISLLKTKAAEDRTEIQQLRERVSILEASASTNKTKDQQTLERYERPARLLPAFILKGKPKNETEEDKRIYGPPTDCSDLNAIGHTLNGYYLVNGSKNSSNMARIQTVYCRFNQPQGEKRSDYETKLGFVDIKSSPVHFSVKRRGDFSNYNGKKNIIKFQDLFLNNGNGFDWSNQCFRAPYPGTYFFSISGSKEYKNKNRVSIYFRVNGEDVEEALSSEYTYYGSFSLQLSLKLYKNDKVDLVLVDGVVYFIYFTGWMVEQDLLM